MGAVIYNGASLIPAPFASFSDESILGGNQERLGTTYRITITGKLINYKGSPASEPYAGGSPTTSWGGWNNVFWINTAYPPDETNPGSQLVQLGQILRKQEALRNLFAQEGYWLEFSPLDGSQAFKCQPKNINITFAEGIWFNTCDYTITAECDVLYLNGQILNPDAVPDLIQNATESWEIQPGEMIKTFNVVHNVSAIGKRVFTSTDGELQPAWQTARDFVNQRLVLGWTGHSSFSPVSGQGIFNQSSLGSGVLNFKNFSTYNASRTETVDEIAGSYNCTETWMAAPTASGSHIYTVSTRRIVDDPYTNVVSNIQGTIKGFYEGLFNYDQRLAAAKYEFDQLGGTTGLLQFITPYSYNGLIYNLQPRAGAIDYNENDGTLSYQYEFSNTLYENDAFDQWTLSRKTSADNYLTEFGIAGNVRGRRYDGDTNVLSPFQRAYSWWTSLSGNNYNALYQRVISSEFFPEAAQMGIQPSPINKSIDFNEAEGVISYSLSWNNRRNDGDVASNNVIETYQINRHFSLDDGIYVYTIQGEIQGLNITDINPQQSKFEAASGYFYGTVVPNVYNRVANYYGVSLPYNIPFVNEVGVFPIAGTISYSYEFRSIFGPILPGALSEQISIQQENYEGNVQVIASIPIPGRSSGPILQNTSTTIAKKRTLSIETVVTPTGGIDIGACIALKPNYDLYIATAVPANSYTEGDSETWQWRYGRYSRQISWIFE